MNAEVPKPSADLIALPVFGETEKQSLMAEAESAHELAVAYVIDSHDMYELAGTELAQIKARRVAVEAKCEELADPFKAIKAKAEEGRKKIYDFFAPAVTRLKAAEGVLTRACVAYQDKVRREREAVEAAAREAQRKLAEQMEKKAAKAEAKGDTAKAEEIRAAVPTVAAPVNLPPEPAKIAGVGFRKIWKGRLVGATDEQRRASKIKLIRFVAKIPQYEHLLDVREPALNDLAKALQATLAATVDGVEAFQDAGSVRQGR